MITIKINTTQQSNANITQQWIAEQILNRKKAGKDICVQIEVRCGDINLMLPFGNCPIQNGGGKGPEPSKKARKLIDEWEKIREKEINPGLIISFWKTALKWCN